LVGRVGGNLGGVSMMRLVLLVGLLFVLAACGGGGADEDASGALAVSSPDGKAVLTLAPGSLPDDVSVDDVQIEWAAGASSGPGTPSVGVRLVPDGLVLNGAASLRLEVPDTVGDQFIVVHVSEGGFEFIGGELDVVDSETFLVTPVEHFSSILMTNVEGLATIITSADPSVVGVGQDQSVSWDIWLEPVSFGVWIPLGPGSDQSQLWTFDDVRLSANRDQFRGHADWWIGGQGSWDPTLARPVPVIDDVVVSFTGSSTCTEVNSIDPKVMGQIKTTMTVKDKGEIVDTDLFRFAAALGQTTPTGKTPDTDGLGNAIPFSATIGKEVDGGFVVRDTVESECTTSGAETTTSSSTTTSPAATSSSTTSTTSSTTTAPPTSPVPPGLDLRAHVTGITPVATPNSTIGLNATFAQPWGPVPPDDLFSFFVLFNILQGNLSLAAGWEVHNQTVTPLGPGPTFLLEDGSILIDTGFPLGPGTPINVTGENGSWPDEATTQPVFGEFMFPVDPSEPLEPIDMDTAVFDLVTQTPLP
jgi:hypothetical protein